MDDMILMEKHDGLGNITQNEGQMLLGNPLVTRVKSFDQINYGSTLTVLEFGKKWFKTIDNEEKRITITSKTNQISLVAFLQ